MNYPFELDRLQMQALLPHRGDIFVGEHLCINGPHSFLGMARWTLENSLIQGHFPGLPVVPGALLIEAAAQLAGAGLLAGDPYVKSLTSDLVGVLAAVRRCAFKQPVLPGHGVAFEIQCRQMGPMAVQVNAIVRAQGLEAAVLDIVMVYTARAQLLNALGVSASPPPTA